MSDKYLLNNDGEPVRVGSLYEWAKTFETLDRRVAEDTLPDGKWVSTVFLGLDHSFGGGVPLLFETMVFSGEGEGRSSLEQERYSTREEALAGHKAMVAKWSVPTPAEGRQP